MTRVEHWELPGKVWAILATWGAAVLVLAVIFSTWMVRSQEQAAAERDRIQHEQDAAMCDMIDNVFLSGPEPVAGPAGDRSRAVQAAMRVYRETLRCDDLD